MIRHGNEMTMAAGGRYCYEEKTAVKEALLSLPLMSEILFHLSCVLLRALFASLIRCIVYTFL